MPYYYLVGTGKYEYLHWSALTLQLPSTFMLLLASLGAPNAERACVALVFHGSCKPQHEQEHQTVPTYARKGGFLTSLLTLIKCTDTMSAPPTSCWVAMAAIGQPLLLLRMVATTCAAARGIRPS